MDADFWGKVLLKIVMFHQKDSNRKNMLDANSLFIEIHYAKDANSLFIAEKINTIYKR